MPRFNHFRVTTMAAFAVLLGAAPGVWAQQSPKDAPSPADLEPGVNTSAPAPADVASPARPAATPAPAAAPAKPTAAAKQATPTKPDSTVPKVAGASSTAKEAAPNGGKGKGGKAEDHLTLDTTTITGNEELPKVLYIVPWKRSDLGDLLGKPANSLLDEVLQPVDRDVFKRENRYYDALKPDASGGADKSGAAAPAAGDKR